MSLPLQKPSFSPVSERWTNSALISSQHALGLDTVPHGGRRVARGSGHHARTTHHRPNDQEGLSRTADLLDQTPVSCLREFLPIQTNVKNVWPDSALWASSQVAKKKKKDKIHDWGSNPHVAIGVSCLLGLPSSALGPSTPPSTSVFATGGHDHAVKLWKLEDAGGQNKIWPLHDQHTSRVDSLAWDDNKQWLYSGGADGRSEFPLSFSCQNCSKTLTLVVVFYLSCTVCGYHLGAAEISNFITPRKSGGGIFHLHVSSSHPDLLLAEVSSPDALFLSKSRLTFLSLLACPFEDCSTSQAVLSLRLSSGRRPAAGRVWGDGRQGRGRGRPEGSVQVRSRELERQLLCHSRPEWVHEGQFLASLFELLRTLLKLTSRSVFFTRCGTFGTSRRSSSFVLISRFTLTFERVVV